MDRKRVKDGINHYHVLKNSRVNWTVLRVLKLTNTNEKTYKLSENGPVETFSSRFKVASALVVVAETNTWDYKAPLLTRN